MPRLIVTPMPIGYHVLPNDEMMFMDEVILTIYRRVKEKSCGETQHL